MAKKIELETPTFDMSNMNKLKLLSFGGTVFFETTPGIKVCLGKSTTNVYVADCDSGSAFADLCFPSGSADFGAPGAQIISIDGKEVSTIDDVVDVIPDLFKKSVFNVKYMRLGGDQQISSIAVKHTNEFATATLYTFDQENKSWIVKSIKNPKHDG